MKASGKVERAEASGPVHLPPGCRGVAWRVGMQRTRLACASCGLFPLPQVGGASVRAGEERRPASDAGFASRTQHLLEPPPSDRLLNDLSHGLVD